MSTKLTTCEGQTWEQLTSHLPEPKQIYLYFVVNGKSKKQAIALANRGGPTVRLWRLDDPYFAELEEYLLSHKDIYAPQAKTGLFSRLDATAQQAIIDLMTIYEEKGWLGIPDKLLPIMKWGIETVRRLNPESSEKSFEERIILERRSKG